MTVAVAVALWLVVVIGGLALVRLPKTVGGGISVDPHRSTVAHFEALYPFQADVGLNANGVYLGRTAVGREPVFYDPFELYRLGKITNPNMVIAGQIGRGKSSLTKTYVRRQAAYGRQAIVIDPKSEFGPLARELGGVVIPLAPGSGVTVNILEAGDEKTCVDLLVALASAALNYERSGSDDRRHLTPEERSGLRLAYRRAASEAAADNRTATLRHVMDALFNPNEFQAEGASSTIEEVAEGLRDVALTLFELCDGQLRGMFDDETTIEGLDWSAPIIVFDLSALGVHDPALPIVMAVVLGWLHPILTANNVGQKVLVLDEAWYLLTDLVLARWLESMFRLSRAYGLQNIIVIHQLSDLESTGADVAAVSAKLLSLAETKFIFAQPAAEIEATIRLLGLNGVEAEFITELQPHVFLAKVASSSFGVIHELGPGDVRIVDTDAAMRNDDAMEVAA